MSSSLFSNNIPQSANTQKPNTSLAADKLKPIANMYKLFENSNNPMAMLEQAASSNPQFKDILSKVNSFSGDPKTAFYTMARQKGMTDIQIDEGLNLMAKTLGINRP